MNRCWIGLMAAGLVLTACKKEEVAATDASAAPRPTSGAGSAAEVRAAEDQAQKALAAKNYDEAATAIYKLKQQPTLSQEEADKLRGLDANLLNAAQKDAKALEAYQNISRAQRGR
jgi:hypothetical protein